MVGAPKSYPWSVRHLTSSEQPLRLMTECLCPAWRKVSPKISVNRFSQLLVSLSLSLPLPPSLPLFLSSPLSFSSRVGQGALDDHVDLSKQAGLVRHQPWCLTGTADTNLPDKRAHGGDNLPSALFAKIRISPLSMIVRFHESGIISEQSNQQPFAQSLHPTLYSSHLRRLPPLPQPSSHTRSFPRTRTCPTPSPSHPPNVDLPESQSFI